MKKLFFYYLFAIGVIFTISNLSQAQNLNTDLFELAKIKSDVKTKRVSSFDQTGGNNDRIEHIKAGEKKVLFDVEGAGVINHIWITIAPPPEGLSRNDIILRMFWYGNDFPSVEIYNCAWT